MYGVILILEMMLAVAIAIFAFVITHLDVFDCIILGIVAASFAHNSLGIHSAVCLIIGIIVAALFWTIMKTRIGFWVITIPFSLLLGAFSSLIAYVATDGDLIWMAVVFGLVTIAALFLHLQARRMADENQLEQLPSIHYDNSVHLHYHENKDKPAAPPKEQPIQADYVCHVEAAASDITQKPSQP